MDAVPLLEDICATARRSGGDVTLVAPASLRLRLRENGLRRALGNLLDNARRHASQVRMAMQLNGRWAEITVDDDGPGIPAAEREAAFKPFASGSATGTGLGLAIARDAVRRHGGEIMLEEIPMGGLRARVRLPV